MSKTSSYCNNLHRFILLAALFHAATSNDDWSYDMHGGADNWYKNFPKCNGKNQSPVNIEKVQEDKNMSPLTLDGYDVPLKEATLVNNGHNVQVGSKDANATMSGGCLDSKYKFTQFNFHWGRDNSKGSEHLVNGTQYPMEGQLVHINVKYGTLDEARKHPDGISVLVVFYQVGHATNQRLQPLINAVEGAGSAGFGTGLRVSKGLTMASLLPDDLSFYCYRNGSLTTPTCDEAVVWTVLKEPVYIGQNQINTFRILRFPDGRQMVNNYRPMQPINNRVIFSYKQE